MSVAKLDEDPGDLTWLAAAGVEPMTLATIWGTVDLDRAIQAAGVGAVADPVADDPFLGARIVLIDGSDGGRIAVAEPSTEGRLAATLARHDEGIVGRYVHAPGALEEVRTLAAAADVSISAPADGPFGRSVLVLGPATGPHLILVEGAAVPSTR